MTYDYGVAQRGYNGRRCVFDVNPSVASGAVALDFVFVDMGAERECCRVQCAGGGGGGADEVGRAARFTAPLYAFEVDGVEIRA